MGSSRRAATEPASTTSTPLPLEPWLSSAPPSHHLHVTRRKPYDYYTRRPYWITSAENIVILAVPI